VPSEIVSRVMILPGALTSALFPRLAFLMNTDADEARRLYKKCLAITAAVMLPICLVLALGAKWGLKIWLGDDFAEQSWLIVCILAIGLLLNGVAFIPFATIQASGDARSVALLHLAELIIYLPLLLFALKIYGLLGAAGVWTIRVGIDMVALLIIANKKFPKSM
jgi:O-antigen/teichoic acid export membrane protein